MAPENKSRPRAPLNGLPLSSEATTAPNSTGPIGGLYGGSAGLTSSHHNHHHSYSHPHHQSGNPIEPAMNRVFRSAERPTMASDQGFHFEASSGGTFNEVTLIQNRRICSTAKLRRNFEFMYEEKVSREQLEEAHTSLPSSLKSTFIMTFSPDGQRVASTHGDHRIYICDLNTGKLLDSLEGHPRTPWCLAWHPSNPHILASGCLAGEVRVWDLRSKACESWTSENNTIISSLNFHPKERVLVIATSNDIHFWDWSESEPFAKTSTSQDKEKVRYVVFDSTGTKLITGIANLPNQFVGCSNESTQSVDLIQATLDHLPQENMTQNSEIANGGPLGSQQQPQPQPTPSSQPQPHPQTSQLSQQQQQSPQQLSSPQHPNQQQLLQQLQQRLRTSDATTFINDSSLNSFHGTTHSPGGSSNPPASSLYKRKNSDSGSDDEAKRRKRDHRCDSSRSDPLSNSTTTTAPSNQPHSAMPEPLPSDRLLVWNNNLHSQSIEPSLQRVLMASLVNTNNIAVRVFQRFPWQSVLPPIATTTPGALPNSNSSISSQLPNSTSPHTPASSVDARPPNNQYPHESRRRALSQDNLSVSGSPSLDNLMNRVGSTDPVVITMNNLRAARAAQLHAVHQVAGLGGSVGGVPLPFETLRHPYVQVYQTRGIGQHVWFNHCTIPFPVSNYRLQCWDFSLSAVPNTKDSQMNVVTSKCRIHNDASIDISADGNLIACLVPRDDGVCLPNYDLKIFSLKASDFGTCYHQLPHGPNAVSVSLSPSAGFAVVGLVCPKFINSDASEDELTIAKVFELNGRNSFRYVRDIKVKRGDSTINLNAIKWMQRGIVYNIGPQNHLRYHTLVRQRPIG